MLASALSLALAIPSINGAAADDILASLSISTSSGPVVGVPTDMAGARATVLDSNYTTVLQRKRAHGRDRCPAGCRSGGGVDTRAWSLYGSLDRLDRACNETVLLNFALFNSVDDPNTHTPVSACTTDWAQTSGFLPPGGNDSNACVGDGVQQNLTEVTSAVKIASWGAPSSEQQLASVQDALRQLQGYLTLASTQFGCNDTITYAHTGGITMGIYAGSGIASQGVLTSVLENLGAKLASSGGSVPESLVAQLCGNSSARYSLGVMINIAGDLGAVQRGIQSWKDGSCLSDLGTPPSTLQTVTYLATSLLYTNSSNNTLSLANTTTSGTKTARRDSLLTSRAECTTVQVVGGDSCETLAAECGITAAQFTEYNSDASLCSSLTPGQHVCCSAGTLPDFTLQPGADGYCYTYLVEKDDSCASIGAAYDLKNTEIESFNSETTDDFCTVSESSTGAQHFH